MEQGGFWLCRIGPGATGSGGGFQVFLGRSVGHVGGVIRRIHQQEDGVWGKEVKPRSADKIGFQLMEQEGKLDYPYLGQLGSRSWVEAVS
jgi:hypothetical protein